MKKHILKIGYVTMLSLFVASCNDDEGVSTDTSINDELSSVEKIAIAEKVDSGIEVIDDIAYQDFEGDIPDGKSSGYTFLPDCATMDFESEEGKKVFTMDFGEDGCEVFGRVLKGKIIMSRMYDMDTGTMEMETLLENFEVDSMQVAGSKKYLREKENANGNRQSTMTMNLTVTTADQVVVDKSGNKEREWIEGGDTFQWDDNVFEIRGMWKTTFADSTSFSKEITTPIRKEATCWYPVSGVVSYDTPDRKGELDYGDGTCDDKATFTDENGEVTEIDL